MRFFKKNSYEIMRLFVIQMGMMIFSFIVSTAALRVTAKNEAMKGTAHLAVCVLATLFYLFVLYTTVWHVGFARSERLENGHAKKDKLYGAKIALFANVPNLFFCVLMAIGLLRFVFDNSFLIALFGVSRLLEGVLNAHYLGIINAISASDNYLLITALSFLSILPSLLVSQIACRLGEKNIRLTKATPPSRE